MGSSQSGLCIGFNQALGWGGGGGFDALDACQWEASANPEACTAWIPFFF